MRKDVNPPNDLLLLYILYSKVLAIPQVAPASGEMAFKAFYRMFSTLKPLHSALESSKSHTFQKAISFSYVQSRAHTSSSQTLLGSFGHVWTKVAV